MMFRRFYSFLLFFAPVLSVALFAQSAPFEEKGVSEHQWTWGIGGANVLDTYLSPLEYVGPDFAVTHRTERLARWGKGNVTTHAF